MIYVLQFEKWVKFGYCKCWHRRALRGFWHLKHPTTKKWGASGLCKKLDSYKLVRLFKTGTKEFEKRLHKSFEGRVGEFHPAKDLPAILDALGHLEVEAVADSPRCDRVIKQACCGGTVHKCFRCDMKFSRREHLARHVANKHRKR